MNFAQAQQKAVELAQAGDLEGIDRLMAQAIASDIPPALVQLLGTHRENAILYRGAKSKSK